MGEANCKRQGCAHPQSEHKGCFIKPEGVEDSGSECNRAGCRCTGYQNA